MPPKNSSSKVTKRTSSRSLTSKPNPKAKSKSKSKPKSETTKINHLSMSTSANVEQNEDPTLYFWKPDQKNGYMGQWYCSAFEHEGETYATAEMWMMVQKARLFGDHEIATEMLQTTDPKKHKSLGRQVRNFDAAIWDKEKLGIVIQGNYLKFTKSVDAATLRGMLLETGEREIVEASPLDRVWGVGFGEKNARRNREKWGRNLLGVAVMEVRRRLREEAAEGEEKE